MGIYGLKVARVDCARYFSFTAASSRQHRCHIFLVFGWNGNRINSVDQQSSDARDEYIFALCVRGWDDGVIFPYTPCFFFSGGFKGLKRWLTIWWWGAEWVSPLSRAAGILRCIYIWYHARQSKRYNPSDLGLFVAKTDKKGLTGCATN